MDEEEWGPWLDHDGKSCPKGFLVEVEFLRGDPRTMVVIAGVKGGRSWFYGNAGDKSTWSSTPTRSSKAIPVIRYRFRKPKGMKTLEKILEELPLLGELEEI